ncbi:hypothetical protein GJAV_G00152910 [Gymnothorax javanicus]|nr:hypothetical protein GJAV_G00152910 [Gymnothorax javanicus]
MPSIITSGNFQQECPDGFSCSSTIPSHYKKYSHFLLAHSRATNDEACRRAGGSLEIVTNDEACLRAGSSQEIVTNDSTLSSQSPSHSQSSSISSSQNSFTNALLLLKSPAAAEIRKKKGWSPITKRRKASDSPLDGGVTPVPSELSSESSTRTEDQNQADHASCLHNSNLAVPSPLSSYDSDDISYSPLSTLPINNENLPCCKSSSYGSVTGCDEGEGDGDSVSLYSDDELLTEFLTQAEMEGFSQPEGSTTTAVNSKQACSTSLMPCGEELNDECATSTSLVPPNLAASALSAATTDQFNEGSTPGPGILNQGCVTHTCNGLSQLQSPQSLVLLKLRDQLWSKGEGARPDSEASSGGLEQDGAASDEMPPVTRRSAREAQASLTPRKAKGKAGGSTSCSLKQTDIGVFFGLKPLKPDAGEASGKENFAGAVPVAGGDGRSRVKVNGRQRKRKATGSASEPPTQEAADVSGGADRRAGRKRWRRRTEDGSEAVRCCPFYKKIPGTPFAVDAFQYGAVEGISAYFLTHFHSDHYNGLRKSSTLPIYCNKITGNLVKSKLRVAEQYIHILPMNTECSVEGVRVTLLDANHCPGAAMLLFVLPNGQTVLHTGDFRADPCMERYPELQRCRVQTLYLDTTYCNPQYTFPTQQEVISFAVSRAFEQVSLNPRTLVVCGTYSVGKEKVFLAIAEVLGCKVSLSRDKYNTMCCLESKRISQIITTDWRAAQVHVLPMMQVNFKNLEAYLSKFSAMYDHILAFRPTGWTYSDQTAAVGDIQPEIRGNVSIYGIPYSEHSSYLEMKRFVQWLRPLKIIPTVNVGSWASRKAMERLFSEWHAEGSDRPANSTMLK